MERALWIRRNYPNRSENRLITYKKELQFVKALRHVEYAMSLSGPKKWLMGDISIGNYGMSYLAK